MPRALRAHSTWIVKWVIQRNCKSRNANRGSGDFAEALDSYIESTGRLRHGLHTFSVVGVGDPRSRSRSPP